MYSMCRAAIVASNPTVQSPFLISLEFYCLLLPVALAANDYGLLPVAYTYCRRRFLLLLPGSGGSRPFPVADSVRRGQCQAPSVRTPHPLTMVSSSSEGRSRRALDLDTRLGLPSCSLYYDVDFKKLRRPCGKVSWSCPKLRIFLLRVLRHGDICRCFDCFESRRYHRAIT